MTYRKLITHASCADGLASAMIVRDAIPDIEVVFAQYNTPSLDQLEPSEGLLFCDISPPPSRAGLFVECGATVLDHHASARSVVESFGERGVFADENARPGVSGAQLAFEHVWMGQDFLEVTPSRAIEDFARLVGVRDTWLTKDPEWQRACDLQAVLIALPAEYWLRPHNIGLALKPSMLDLGASLREERARKVASVAEHGVVHVIDGQGHEWSVFPDPKGLTSDVAEELRRLGHPLCVGFFTVVAGGELQTVLSFRSDGSVDVGDLAKSLGGGGHSRAAGCQLPYSDPWDAIAEALRFIR